MQRSEKYFYSILLLEIISLALINLTSVRPILLYTFSYIISSLLFFILAIFLLRINITHKNILILILLALILRLSFLFTDPIGSDDVYRYMWDGKLQTHGINPYLYKPLDEKLNHFHSDLLPSAMNFKEMRTIYFPVSQWLFFLGFQISGEEVWGYKLLLFLFEILTFYLLYRILGSDQKKYLLLYAFCPLPIIHFAVDAHLDGFGLPLILFAFYFYQRNKKIFATIFLGLSFSIKPVGIILLPILFLAEKNFWDKIKITIIPMIAFFLQFIPYIFTSNPFEAFLIYSKHWFYNGMVFNLINSFIHNNQTSRLICSILLILVLIPLYFSKKEFTQKIYFSILLLMIFSPVVHPWYVVWLLIFTVFVFNWSGIWFAAISSLTALTILNFRTNGIWIDYWWVQLIEYLPVIGLMILELFPKFKNHWFPSRTTQV